MVNIAVFSDLPFGDKDAMLDFLGAHAIAHSGIASTIMAGGGLIESLPLSESPDTDSSWMQDHYQAHLSIGKYLGQSVPDLSGYDLKKPEQFDDWMAVHGDLHTSINAALGITT